MQQHRYANCDDGKGTFHLGGFNLKKRLACLHAHYSNIDYIEQAFCNFEEVELVHFVDPGLMQRVSQGAEGLSPKVKEQLQWIAGCDVDGILITCTNYIALMKDEQLSLSVPIIKIDEPYFETICNNDQHQTILFTNPATVEGTMARLQQFAKQQEKSIKVEAKVIDHTFELIMQGQKEAYNKAILRFLHETLRQPQLISVAQLSMVAAAQQFEKEMAIAITHPLQALVSTVLDQLKIG